MRVESALNLEGLTLNSNRIQTAGKRDCKKECLAPPAAPGGTRHSYQEHRGTPAMTVVAAAIFVISNFHGHVGETILIAVTFM